MTTRRMYVSGGIGSRYDGESFGKDYELPNDRAYTETCAAIGAVMWAWRMLLLTGDAKYADLIEHALFNAVIPGISLDGETYFYQNPLADDGTHRRQPWFHCACCPPNVARLLASLPGYVYTTADDAIAVHLYAEGTAVIAMPGERTVRLRQRTRYPWDGDVAIEVDGAGPFAVRLRVPAWCEQGATLAVNDEAHASTLRPGSYVEIRRDWHPGDVIRLHLPMPVRRIECHPYVTENAGHVALMRGPILYCLEEADTGGAAPRDHVLAADTPVAAGFQPDLLGGVVTLAVAASVAPVDLSWANTLYRTACVVGAADSPVPVEPITVRAIPYFAWANREPGAMRVWLRTDAGTG
jgi:hypothetical protein